MTGPTRTRSLGCGTGRKAVARLRRHSISTCGHSAKGVDSSTCSRYAAALALSGGSISAVTTKRPARSRVRDLALDKKIHILVSIGALAG